MQHSSLYFPSAAKGPKINKTKRVEMSKGILRLVAFFSLAFCLHWVCRNTAPEAKSLCRNLLTVNFVAFVRACNLLLLTSVASRYLVMFVTFCMIYYSFELCADGAFGTICQTRSSVLRCGNCACEGCGGVSYKHKVSFLM